MAQFPTGTPCQTNLTDGWNTDQQKTPALPSSPPMGSNDLAGGLQEMLQKKFVEMTRPQTPRRLSPALPNLPKATENQNAENHSARRMPRSRSSSLGPKTDELRKKTSSVSGNLYSLVRKETENKTPFSLPKQTMNRLKETDGGDRSSTLEMRSLARSSAKKNEHECTVVNPLLDKIILTTKNLPEYLPTLYALSDKNKKFNEEDAKQEVMKCVQYHNGFSLIIKKLSEIEEQIKENKTLQDRWYKFFAVLFLHPQSASLLNAFFEKSVENCNDFAKKMIDCILELEVNNHTLIHALSIFTKENLKKQQSATLFREANISSSLCTIYGCYLLTEHLKTIEGVVKEEFIQARKRLEEKSSEDILLKQEEGIHYHLCVDVKRLQEEMKNRVKDFTNLTLIEQQDFANRRLEENTPFFKLFATNILTKLYDLPFPADFCSLLQMRRKAIEEKILDRDHSLENRHLAEVFSGELLCLRILSPFLTTLGKTELEKSILVTLSKILQQLSNQVEFDTKNSGFLLPTLKEIYNHFIEPHRSFVNELSLSNFKQAQ
jgi:hypothetical protein